MTRTPAERKNSDIRLLTIETQVSRYAEGSAVIRAGHTHVLCAASIEESVPRWLEGKGKGWVTAEYSMLPRSTHTRSKRDREKVSGRTQEIQRLIARALRGCVDLSKLGERRIIVDCDVIQADGGTRTASITGGCVALFLAIQKLLDSGDLKETPWIDTVSAVSLGIKEGQILVDLDYNEDSTCDVDMNFVMTGKGDLIEVQGTAEGAPFSVENLQNLTRDALEAGRAIREIQLQAMK